MKRCPLIIFSLWYFIIPGDQLKSQVNPKAEVPYKRGFQDLDHDGINDFFVDRDGNGINDVTGVSYLHAFDFQDKNNDGINDLWVDEDGDGVNDRLSEIEKKQTKWIDANGDGLMDMESSQFSEKALKAHVLDVDQDGRNDITGEKITGEDLNGYRFGCVYEERGIKTEDFKDSDGDGIHDRFMQLVKDQQYKDRQMDYFLDIDGDGVSDDRGLGRLLGREKSKGRGQGRGRGDPGE